MSPLINAITLLCKIRTDTFKEECVSEMCFDASKPKHYVNNQITEMGLKVEASMLLEPLP